MCVCVCVCVMGDWLCDNIFQSSSEQTKVY